MLPALAALQAESEKTRERDAAFAGIFMSSSMLNAAHSAHLLSVEKAKKNDMDREPEYQERNWKRIREGQERAQRTIDARIDKALLAWAMGYAAALPADQRIAGLDKLVGLTPGMAKADSDKAIADYLDKLLAGTKMADKDFRLGLLDKTTAEIAATKDPMVDLALALDPLYQAEPRGDEEAAGRRDAAPPALHAGPPRAVGRPRRAGRERHAARDLRHREGQAGGRTGRSGRPSPRSRASSRRRPARASSTRPARELEAIKALRAGKQTPYVLPAIGDVPVDFLSTVDTTGGNSGSPTLNGKGEFVGLLFDGTYDTIASDFLFDTVNTRSIHADVRYMLWVMSEVDGAEHLIREMGS